MCRGSEAPDLEELVAAPELAILHALEATLDAASSALLAAHPELAEQDLAGDMSPALDVSGWMADSIVTHIFGLNAAIARYRRELARARRVYPSEHPF